MAIVLDESNCLHFKVNQNVFVDCFQACQTKMDLLLKEQYRLADPRIVM